MGNSADIMSSYRPISVEHVRLKNILNFKGFYVLWGEPGRGEFWLKGWAWWRGNFRKREIWNRPWKIIFFKNEKKQTIFHTAAQVFLLKHKSDHYIPPPKVLRQWEIPTLTVFCEVIMPGTQWMRKLRPSRSCVIAKARYLMAEPGKSVPLGNTPLLKHLNRHFRLKNKLAS